MNCVVTNTVIEEIYRNEVVLVVLERDKYRVDNEVYLYPYDEFKLTPYILKGKYDGYGGLELDSIEYDNQFKSYLIQAITTAHYDTNIKPKGAIREFELKDITPIQQKDYANDIAKSEKLSDIPYLTEDVVKTLLRTSYSMFIHREVYDRMLTHDFEEFGFKPQEVKTYLKYVDSIQQKVRKLDRTEEGRTKLREVGIFYRGNNLLKSVNEVRKHDIKGMYNLENGKEKGLEDILKEQVGLGLPEGEDYTEEDFRTDNRKTESVIHKLSNDESVFVYTKSFEERYELIKTLYGLKTAFYHLEVLIRPSLLSGMDGDKDFLFKLVSDMDKKGRICIDCENQEDECECGI